MVLQRVVPVPTQAPERLALVVDTSLGSEPAILALARALPALPRSVQTRLALPGDHGFRWEPAVSEGTPALIQVLNEVEAGGGVDNVAALTSAAQWAREVEHGVVLWLHGAQPVLLGDAEGLQNTFERARVRVIHAQAGDGEHVLLGSLGSVHGLEALPRLGSLESDLRRQFELWAGRQRQWRLAREQLALDEKLAARRTSDHLVRLWAFDEVSEQRAEHPARATRLAVAQRLVTPLTGAVVLENHRQYVEAGLDPEHSGESMPSVPEPETWALLIVCAGLLFWQLRRRPLRTGVA
jgi:hypothetical protein